MRKLLALPLLPAEHIQPAFTGITSAGVADDAVDQRLTYVSSTWLENSLVGREPIRLRTARPHQQTTMWKDGIGASISGRAEPTFLSTCWCGPGRQANLSAFEAKIGHTNYGVII